MERDELGDELLTVSELAKWWKKAPQTIYDLLSKGELPHVKIRGCSVRFRRSALSELMIDHPVGKAGTPVAGAK